MKRLFTVLLVATALLGSCKEESVVRVEQGTTKSIKGLLYTFSSSGGNNAVKSNASTGSEQGLSQMESKVISEKIWEEGGKTFIASLIEENEPVETKAPTQVVGSANVYTFYAYKGSEIVSQGVDDNNKEIMVPRDEATKYGMIFLSLAKGMDNPAQFNPTEINKASKEIIHHVNVNENVCYAIYNKNTMPSKSTMDITFTPLFSQLGILVPSLSEGIKIEVNNVKLVSGGQKTARVKVAYISDPEDPKKNIAVIYDKLVDFPVDMSFILNATNNTYYLNPPGANGNKQQGYYNIIPNGQTAKVYIKMTAGGIEKEKTIDFGVPFSSGKRYTIKVEHTNLVVPIEIVNFKASPASIKTGEQSQLTVIVKYSNGETKTNPNGLTFTSSNENVIPSPENATLLRGYTGGAADITAKIGAITKTVTVNVKRDVLSSGNWSWTYDFNNPATTVTRDYAKRYIEYGAYWVDDGPEYQLPNKEISRKGVMLLKLAYQNLQYKGIAEAKTLGGFHSLSKVEQSKRFFLPAAGRYTVKNSDADWVYNGGGNGYYLTNDRIGNPLNPKPDEGETILQPIHVYYLGFDRTKIYYRGVYCYVYDKDRGHSKGASACPYMYRW